MFEADIEAFEVLADENEVDVLIAAALHDRLAGADIGVEVEFGAERDVDRAEPAADRRGQGSLQREAGLADARERLGRQRLSVLFDRGQASEMDVPVERRACRLQDADHGLGDFGADTIAGDERGGKTGRGCHWFAFCRLGREASNNASGAIAKERSAFDGVPGLW